jgi:XTP/dITP diphosphohydrolase
MIVWFATGNVHKKEELAAILSDTVQSISPGGTKGGAFELKIPAEAGLCFEPEETGNSFLENSLLKAGEFWRKKKKNRPNGVSRPCLYTSGEPVIADDSGLCVDALNGRPGILSARYGNGKLDAAGKNAMLLAELGDNPLRSARFVCAMVLYFGPDRFYTAQETMEGELVKDSARGSGGFGYDPIFYIPGLGRTAAELSVEEKNRLSHRAKAGRIIARILAGL